MAEFLPIIIVGAIIGTFTVIFLTAYILEKKNKSTKVRRVAVSSWFAVFT